MWYGECGYNMRLHTRAEDEEHYEKANDEWLLDKIERERKAIKVNEEMIGDSRYEIDICEDILFRRKQERKHNVHEQ